VRKILVFSRDQVLGLSNRPMYLSLEAACPGTTGLASKNYWISANQIHALNVNV
jgi:hypothetical protein